MIKKLLTILTDWNRTCPRVLITRVHQQLLLQVPVGSKSISSCCYHSLHLQIEAIKFLGKVFMKTIEKKNLKKHSFCVSLAKPFNY